MDVMKQTGTEWYREYSKSKLISSRKLRGAEYSFFLQINVQTLSEMLMQEAVEKLDDRVTSIAE